MKIPLSKPYFDKTDEDAIVEVLKSGWVMQGPKVNKFEKMLSNYIRVNHAIAVSSGTAALHLSLLTLNIGRGDEVIVPSFSFVATANCVLYVGATAVFADINSKTFNIDPTDIKKKITKKTKAIIAVHQIGLPAEINEIKKICQENKLFLIEDAACALGATYNGVEIGRFGDLACFSLHPRKSITTGEGGFITTNDDKLADKLKILRNHGLKKMNGEDQLEELGYNYRLTDIQAALGISQFSKFEMLLSKRKRQAEYYNKSFSDKKNLSIPFVPSGLTHAYQSYMLTFEKKQLRDKAYDILKKNQIAAKKSITQIHKQPLYKNIIKDASLPVSEDIASRSLLIPIYHILSEKEQEVIVRYILKTI